VKGASRRVQTRLDTHLVGSPVFPLQGAIGIDHVKIGNSNGSGSNQINGALGTNGTITLRNNVTVSNGCHTPAGSTPLIGNGASCPVVPEQQSFAVTVPSSLEVNGNTFASTATTNDDAQAGAAYSPGGRALHVTSDMTLPSGTYNFCSILIDKNVTLSFAAGAQVAIFLDSNLGDPLGCPRGSGTITVNGTIVNDASNRAPSLQLYVYGTQSRGGANDIMFNQNATITATLYAPNSVISTTNALTWTGAMFLWGIDIKNGITLNADPDTSSILTNATLTEFRSGNWRECRSTPTTSTDPESGCT
jgi:hypothetical protein